MGDNEPDEQDIFTARLRSLVSPELMRAIEMVNAMLKPPKAFPEAIITTISEEAYRVPRDKSWPVITTISE